MGKRTTPRRARWLGLALVATGALVTGGVVTDVGATPIEATGTATLKDDHVGATNPGFQTGECPTPPDGAGTWGWHFVLQGNETVFVTVTATFEHEGVVTDFISHPNGKHAYVYTSGPDTLLGATATVSGPDTEFNLSHVCAGEDQETTTTTGRGTTSTTVGETTTTTEGEETTTTTEAEETTTTTEAEETTTTTEAEETTTTTGDVGETTTTLGEETTSTTEGEEETTTTEGEDTTTTEAAAGSSSTPAPAARVLGVTQERQLPRTGSETTALAAVGLLLLVGGLVVLERSRRLA